MPASEALTALPASRTLLVRLGRIVPYQHSAEFDRLVMQFALLLVLLLVLLGLLAQTGTAARESVT
jgi:hypothetical protein